MAAEIKTVSDLTDIVRRRKWYIALPALVIFTVSAVVALSLPKIYRSTSTILIESQEVPQEYVAANITSFADQRLQSINQRIMGSTRLLEIMNRFALYEDLKSRQTVEEILDRMRKDITFSTISADVVDPRTGRPAQATIAFSLSFEGKNPAQVQKVAGELASLYLEENLQVRERQSLQTSRFMEEEMKALQESLAAVETKIADYKQRNLTSLPELSQVNLQGLDQADRDVSVLEQQMRALSEREGYLQSELASTPPELFNHDKEALKELRTQLVDLKSRFSDEYPDVVKTKAAIRDLEARLRARPGGERGEPDNPAYVTLASQLAGVRAEIQSVRRQLGALREKRESYRGRIEATPRVEEGYKSLLAERDNLRAKYDEMTKKFMDARVAHGLEKEQLGERFSIIDPARLPEKPVSPNVPAILLIGLILGLGSGVGAAALKESSDQSVRTVDGLARLVPVPVLAGVPEICAAGEIAATRGRRRIILLAALVLLTAAVLIFNFLIMDLDVFWARILRRF